MSNRSARRREHRAARRDLRRIGCSCCPTIAERDDGGFAVRHEAGCPFGDRFLADNARGVAPIVIVGPHPQRGDAS